MKKVFIISLSQIHRDPRVLRQIQFLESSYEITVAGLTNPNIKSIKFININLKPPSSFLTKLWEVLLAFIGFFDYLYWKQPHIKQLKNTLLRDIKDIPNIVIANDAQVLPLAVHLCDRWSAALITDLHEYAPLELEDLLTWRLRYKRYYYFLLKKYLKNSKSVTTVCESIRQKLYNEFNEESYVLTNAPVFEDLSPSEIDPNRIRIVHHGGAMRSRNLHLMIEMFQWLDERFELNLILMDSDKGYLDELKKKSRSNDRIIFHDLVPTEEISAFINQFDIGLCIVPPINFNYAIGLPNKFFEFIQARLCIAVGPSIEMASLTHRHKLGIVSADFSSQAMAKSLNALSIEQIKSFKFNSNIASSELSSSKNKELLLSIIKKEN